MDAMLLKVPDAVAAWASAVPRSTTSWRAEPCGRCGSGARAVSEPRTWRRSSPVWNQRGRARVRDRTRSGPRVTSR